MAASQFLVLSLYMALGSIGKLYFVFSHSESNHASHSYYVMLLLIPFGALQLIVLFVGFVSVITFGGLMIYLSSFEVGQQAIR